MQPCLKQNAQTEHPRKCPWAARYNTWLLIKLTPKGVVFSFLFSQKTPCSKGASACTGVGMAKMTPFRSYIVTSTVAAETALLGTVQLKGGVITYIMVRQ